MPARAVRGEGELPPAGDQGEMLATENFFYTARFLGLPERRDDRADGGRGGEGVRRGVAVAGGGAPGGEQGGEREGEDETFEEDESSLARYCFSSSLIVAALSHGLKLPAQAKIRFSNSVGGKAVDWAMGAAIAFTAAAVEREEEWLLGDPAIDGRARLATSSDSIGEFWFWSSRFWFWFWFRRRGGRGARGRWSEGSARRSRRGAAPGA